MKNPFRALGKALSDRGFQLRPEPPIITGHYEAQKQMAQHREHCCKEQPLPMEVFLRISPSPVASCPSCRHSIGVHNTSGPCYACLNDVALMELHARLERLETGLNGRNE